MRSIADGSVWIQTSTEEQAATPSWLGEVALVASHLQKQGILNTRGKDYGLLDHTAIQARLSVPADHHLQSAESGICRTLYDCPDLRLSQDSPLVRVSVATHPAPTKKKKKRQVGIIGHGVVYELFLTNLPQSAFTAFDVVSLSLHRGAFETALEDEDIEHDPDRWCSHSAWGQEAWQIVAQWTWNLRLELGHQLVPEPLRPTEFAPALAIRRMPTRPCLLPPHLNLGMLLLSPRRPGKLAASQEPTFPSSRMGPCAVLLATCWFLMSSVENAIAVSVWSLPPAFALVVRVRCGSSANGTAAPRPNRAR